MTFYRETVEEIDKSGHTPEDIAFIGSADGEYGCTWAEFKNLADFTYNSSYGAAHIPQDLVVVFTDGSWLSRGEYAGSEWWNYHKALAVPEIYKTITTLGDGYSPAWDTVAEVIREAEVDE